jgi:mono/diheme cytochrome c family protein
MTQAFFILTLAYSLAWLLPQGGPVTQTTPRRGGNPVAARVMNPVPPSAVSIEAGRKIYRTLCSRCHGPDGKGDGGGAGAGGQPANFTDEEWEFGSSDGEIFAAIAEGTSADMESYAERIPSAEIWNLVNYLRSFKPGR